MIKTIIFDIGNVLAGFDWKEYYESRGYTGQQLQRISDATIYSGYWIEFDRGCLTTQQVIDRFVEMDPGFEQEIRTALADVSGMMRRYDYAIPWIKALKAAGYKVLFLSNFSEKVLQDCWDALDFLPHTDGGVLSYQHKLVKPDPAIYHLILSRYALRAEECVFLDDVQENIDAAKAAGMEGIRFENRQQAAEALRALGVDWEDAGIPD